MRPQERCAPAATRTSATSSTTARSHGLRYCMNGVALKFGGRKRLASAVSRSRQPSGRQKAKMREESVLAASLFVSAFLVLTA